MRRFGMKFGKIFLTFSLFYLTTFSVFSSEILLWDLKKPDALLRVIKSGDGKNNIFYVKIAKSDQERQRGLMFINSMPKNQGMVFEFKKSQIINMWMKNTKIELDIIFIDKNNRIISIKHNATPFSKEIISSETLANKVLEINGGLAKKLNINNGDLIEINDFLQ